jgi:hemerythrin-like domain-containing protein
MKLTDRLKVEHGVYLLQLRHVEELLAAQASPEAVAASLSTIVVAEDHHSRLEDEVLYPQLAQRLGPEAEVLVEVRKDHERLHDLAAVARLHARPDDVVAFIGAMRAHLEREIHHLFPLADELLSETLLSSLGNWQEDHIRQELGRPEPWARPSESES